MFEPGNKLAKGGNRDGAGRPSAKALRELLKAVNKAQAKLVNSADKVFENYIKLAGGWYETRYTLQGREYEVFKYDSKATCHFVDKLLPDDHNVTIQPTAIIHQFIQFGAPDNPNTIQLPAEGVSTPILVGDGRGQETSSEVLAQEIGQGQDRLEFHSFTHVPRK